MVPALPREPRVEPGRTLSITSETHAGRTVEHDSYTASLGEPLLIRNLQAPRVPLAPNKFFSTQFTNRLRRTLFTSPSIKKLDKILDPPALISGRVMPVTGIRPTTMPAFTST